MKSLIPNALTALNLVFGVFALISAFQGDFAMTAVFIVTAMVADGLDGRAARFFQVSSEFGKELDSLCDLVSFGVAPAVLGYAFVLHQLGNVGYIVAAFFAVCGAMRLARFNVNTGTVKGYFMGLPIPAGGCVMATFVLLGVKPSAELFAAMMIVVGYLMVSTIKYPDFKGKGEKIYMLPVAITAAAAVYLAVTVIHTALAVLFVPFFAYTILGILNTAFRFLAVRSA